MSNTEKESLLKTAFLDTPSLPNGAVFFSGPKAKRQAKKVTKNDDQKTSLLDTPALKAFGGKSGLCYGKNPIVSLQEYYAIGDWISEKFANEASGTVAIYLDGVKAGGTFARYEIPTLLNNPNVTDFEVYDYQTIMNQKGAKLEAVNMNKDELKAYIDVQTSKRVDRRVDNAHRATGASLQLT